MTVSSIVLGISSSSCILVWLVDVSWVTAITKGREPSGSGYPFQRTLHHRPGARRVKVYHIHVQSGQNRHGLFYCVGNIMEFQVQKDLMPPLP